MENFIDARNGTIRITEKLSICPGTHAEEMCRHVALGDATQTRAFAPYEGFDLVGDDVLDRQLDGSTFFKFGKLYWFSCTFIGKAPRVRPAEGEPPELLGFHDRVLLEFLGEPHAFENQWDDDMDGSKLCLAASRRPKYIYEWGMVWSSWSSCEAGAVLEVCFFTVSAAEVAEWRRTRYIPPIGDIAAFDFGGY